jgi:serine/threonine-protein kinase RIO1
LNAISTDIQRKEAVDLCDVTEEWLYDEGRGKEAAVYKEKLSAIKKIAVKIFKRYVIRYL